jgi:hypothetical protein
MSVVASELGVGALEGRVSVSLGLLDTVGDEREGRTIFAPCEVVSINLRLEE